MDFGVLIIPLIALGVWILGTIFAKTEEPPARRPVRPPGERGPIAPRPTSDLDRFLEEARRRREAAGSRPMEPIPAPAPSRPIPRAEPARPPQTTERRPPRPRETVSTQPQTRREMPRTTPVPPTPQPRPPARAPAEVAAAAGIVELVAPRPVGENYKPLDKAPILGTAVTRRPQSPVAAQVLTLLRTPGSVGAAFLLREILAPPLCKRRGS